MKKTMSAVAIVTAENSAFLDVSALNLNKLESSSKRFATRPQTRTHGIHIKKQSATKPEQSAIAIKIKTARCQSKFAPSQVDAHCLQYEKHAMKSMLNFFVVHRVAEVALIKCLFEFVCALNAAGCGCNLSGDDECKRSFARLCDDCGLAYLECLARSVDYWCNLTIIRVLQIYDMFLRHVCH